MRWGVDVLYHYTMGDNPGRLKSVMQFAMQDCDLFHHRRSGAHGGRSDERDALRASGEELILHEPTMQMIDDYFERVWYKKTENNINRPTCRSTRLFFRIITVMAPDSHWKKTEELSSVCRAYPGK